MTAHVIKEQDAHYDQAKLVIGRAFYIRSWNEKYDPKIFTAFKIFQQLASENYGKAYYPLSCLYRESQDVRDEDQNQAKHFGKLAFEWSIANQANQDVEVWCDLGEMFICGYVVERNADHAVAWWRKAAELGFVDAQWSLGVTFLDGNGVARDLVEAEKWLRHAANQGDANAQGCLGLMYIDGDGVPQDRVEAQRWMRLAAEQGDINTQTLLGLMYEHGDEFPQDFKEAEKWYRMAASQGDPIAQSALEELCAK